MLPSVDVISPGPIFPACILKIVFSTLLSDHSHLQRHFSPADQMLSLGFGLEVVLGRSVC